MNGTSKHRLVALVLLGAISGCSSPANLFSWIDRNCFVADWTNHNSCVSCCNCKHGSCQGRQQLDLPMLELGNPPMQQAEKQESTASEAMSTAFEVE